MTKFLGSLCVVVAMVLAITILPGQAGAGESRVPLPVLAKAAKGKQCVEPAAVMRRNHMKYLMHQREETVRQGIRGKKYSLRQCTECHATADPNIDGGKVRTLQPFCNQCHEYAAVKPDCFSCHNPTLPLLKNSAGSDNSNGDDRNAVLQWMIASHLKKSTSTVPGPEKSQKDTSQ